jgi:thiamine biosynthesis protein ThiC
MIKSKKRESPRNIIGPKTAHIISILNAIYDHMNSDNVLSLKRIALTWEKKLEVAIEEDTLKARNYGLIGPREKYVTPVIKRPNCYYL